MKMMNLNTNRHLIYSYCGYFVGCVIRAARCFTVELNCVE